MTKAILFDLGEVLVMNPAGAVLQEVARNLNIDLNKLKEIRKKYVYDLDTGKLSVSSFNKILKDKFNLPISSGEIDSIWKKSYRKVRTLNIELFNIAKQLKKKYKVGMISNIHDLMVRIDKGKGVFELFDPCVLSCEVGIAKPQKEIFELTLKKLKLKPEECVFIDNREKHLVVATELGFKTILFKNNQQLVKDLKVLGIKI